MLQAGIGEMVHSTQIKAMNQFIADYGKSAFMTGVFHGMFSEVCFAYIHPADAMKSTDNFDVIQRVFISAYV